MNSEELTQRAASQYISSMSAIDCYNYLKNHNFHVSLQKPIKGLRQTVLDCARTQGTPEFCLEMKLIH